ncbi:MAG: hypothetical protein J6T74_07920 [Clostridia bacterium]|nr:hypothetical protein [Clostridia bacterium]
MENEDLKYIKKHYSEKMAHLCRELFPTLLETPGLLTGLLEQAFAHSSSLADDIIDGGKKDGFKSFIYAMSDSQRLSIASAGTKTPEQLMDEAGYILYPECKTEEEIQSFKHYYASGEEICTFNGRRLESCRVWFAVKKDVDQIKREDFDSPLRQDEYGTSVISIQFSKGEKNILSIKNRYNHRVSNPDATFSNDLENIRAGLSDAFAVTYGLNIYGDLERKLDFKMDNYVVANDGKRYRYNCEIDGVYYCENNIIIENNEPKKLDPARYIVMDYFIVDMAKGSQSITTKHKDSFPKSIGEIASITVERDENKNRVVRFKVKDGEDVLITLDSNNRIIKIDNKNLEHADDFFLNYDLGIKELNLPSLKSVGSDFLHDSKKIEELSLPLLESAGDRFMGDAKSLTKLDLPKIKRIGGGFCYLNKALTELNAPKLEYEAGRFLFTHPKRESFLGKIGASIEL